MSLFVILHAVPLGISMDGVTSQFCIMYYYDRVGMPFALIISIILFFLVTKLDVNSPCLFEQCALPESLFRVKWKSNEQVSMVREMEGTSGSSAEIVSLKEFGLRVVRSITRISLIMLGVPAKI